MAYVRVSRTVLAVALVALLALSVSAFSTARPSAHASPLEVVSLTPGTAVHLATPVFLQVGKRYAFTWPGGGPPQTFAVKQIRPDGWILVDVADDITRPELYIPGEFPTRWLHAGLAISIQEMRALP
jgi:hypothetical protein